MTTNSSTAPGSMVIKPRVRGFICVTAHPLGCQAAVLEQIAYVKKQGPLKQAPKRVLIIGASTGYGLSSRIVSAFAGGASTIGLFFEKPSEGGRPATAGWYNSAAFDKAAKEAGLYSLSINGDAFSYEIKDQTIEAIKRDLGQVDLVIYSLASPRRKHPESGHVYNSVLKPIGAPYTAKTLDTDKEQVKEITIEPAGAEDVAETIGVMGGEGWELWIDKLQTAGALAPGAITVAYSYIGPDVTWPIYKDGTIGAAKADLDRAARHINDLLSSTGGKAYVSINQAIVTQASSAIPVVPLYISLLFKILREKGILEGCLEQIYRLFASELYGGRLPRFDADGRIRVDDLEMRADVQAKIRELWGQVTTENLKSMTDFEAYKMEFLKLFGFGVAGIDYDKEVDPACL